MISFEGHVEGSSVGEDSQTEIFNKRKALLPKDQMSQQDSKDYSHKLSETSGDFPQKKQKVASSQYPCNLDGIYEEKYDL